jgi:NitT/TauT family transport system permease protein
MYNHIWVTVYETLISFSLGTIMGLLIATLLWRFNFLAKVIDPYLTIINCLPKLALGPIIIVWFGAGEKSIIFMAVLIGIIVSIITMQNGFLAVDKNKIFLLKSMGATKFQIMIKLVIPGSTPSFISMLKINVGMAWIGSIMGEYLVSRSGLGYLIVYGGQVFKLDLVMASTVILCILAALMYVIVALLEKLLVKHK